MQSFNESTWKQKPIIPNQHGFRVFRRGRSVLTNLIDTYNHVTLRLELNNSVDVIYLDFEKAFDKEDRLLLINKLVQMQISKLLENFYVL